jgi:hypothetical protein
MATSAFYSTLFEIDLYQMNIIKMVLWGGDIKYSKILKYIFIIMNVKKN